MARVYRTLARFVLVALVGAATAGSACAQSAEPKSDAATKAAPKKSAAGKSSKKAADAAKAAEDPNKPRDPAVIQKSLETAQKSLDTGKADQAVGQINALIAAGGLDARSMARALAIRGHAYKKQSKPAQAISDLQSALWLKGGLSDSERAAATQARIEAYREAGLGDAPSLGGKGGTTAAGGSQGSGRAAQAISQPGSNSISTAAVGQRAEPAPAPSGGGGGGFFANLFGGSSSKQAVAEPSPVKAPATAAVSSWTAEDAKPVAAKAGSAVASVPKGGESKVATASAAAAAAGKAGGATAAPGSVRLQLAAVKDRAAAQAMGERVKKEHAAELASRKYDIEETTFGNMGTFYRVRIGPYASAADANGLCGALRGKGIDCMVVPN